jgi:Putative peptidoglycan binding domain
MIKNISKKPVTVLAILTAIFITVGMLSAYKIITKQHLIYEDEDETDVDRNEQSTPRSFVLPATPAVTVAQENKQIQISKGLDSDKCLIKLKDLGFPIDDLDSSFNAKYIEAIIKFQEGKRIPVTGQIDQVTRKNLGC